MADSDASPRVHAHRAGNGRQQRRSSAPAAALVRSRRPPRQPHRPARSDPPPPPNGSVAVHDSQPGSLLPTTTAADAKRGPDSRGPQSTQTSLANALLPTTVATDATGVANNVTLAGRLLGGPPCRPSTGIADRNGQISRDGWQQYQPAVDRWAELIGRPPPVQVQASAADNRRLIRLIHPDLTEWMMGYPPGWCTDLVATRPALRLIGNSICPQQARLAVRMLLDTRRWPPMPEQIDIWPDTD